MEQLVILTKNYKAYITSPAEDSRGIQNNDWFDVSLPDHTHTTVKRQDVDRLWLRDKENKNIIVSDANLRHVSIFHSNDDEAQQIFEKLMSLANGLIEPTRTTILGEKKLLMLEFEAEDDTDEDEAPIASEDEGKHAMTTNVELYNVWTNEKDYLAATRPYFRRTGKTFPKFANEIDFSHALKLNREDFETLNRHGMVYAYFKQSEQLYLPPM